MKASPSVSLQFNINFWQELAAWVHNNWRPFSTTCESNIHLKINHLNVIWETQKEAVEDELKIIVGVDELDNRDPRYFQQRNAAAKRVLRNMSEWEQEEFDNEIEARKARGHPEPVKHEWAYLFWCPDAFILQLC